MPANNQPPQNNTAGQQNNNQAPGVPENKALTLQEKNIAENVLARITEMQNAKSIDIPPNYSAANALKSAWLIIQEVVDKDKNLALTVCSKDSIAQALLNMVIQGLNPVKHQCYFIVRGKKLTMQRSYHGTQVATKRLDGILDIYGNVIYEGDEFEYEIDTITGLKKVLKHKQELKNINPDKILGAYATITRKERPPFVEIMNIEQIKKAWNQGDMKGDSKAHNNFRDEMCIKSVINRGCKKILESSDDSGILIDSLRNTPDIEDLPEEPYEEVATELSDKANKEVLDIKKPEEPKPEVKEEPKPEPAAPSKGNGRSKAQAEPTLDGPGF
ncbi:MAG TPA: RecT family recombinase [Ignavibacteriales bacterium]|nr:RecT family recombinase [Ignavibacteriales bacterium]